MTEVAVAEALGELFSPSQVNTYITCPAKWYFRITEYQTAGLVNAIKQQTDKLQ